MSHFPQKLGVYNDSDVGELNDAGGVICMQIFWVLQKCRGFTVRCVDA